MSDTGFRRARTVLAATGTRDGHDGRTTVAAPHGLCLRRAAWFTLLFTGAFIVSLAMFADVMTHLHPSAVVAGTVPLKVFAAPLLAGVAEQCVTHLERLQEHRHDTNQTPTRLSNQGDHDG